MRQRGRRAVLVGVVLAFALLMGACGAGGDDRASVSIRALQAAATNTQAEESSRFVVDVAVDGGGDAATLHGEGVVSGDGRTGQVSLTMPSKTGTIEERIVDGALYVRVGDLLGTKLGNGQWIKLDLDGDGLGVLGGLVDAPRAATPTQGLEFLQGLSGDVEKVGDDTVAGRHAVHYRASIDYSDLARELPDASAKQRDALDSLGTVPADVWIDDQDRVVKMHFVIDVGALGDSHGRAEMTMQITDFGVPVDVQAPPPGDVVDVSSLRGLKI